MCDDDHDDLRDDDVMWRMPCARFVDMGKCRLPSALKVGGEGVRRQGEGLVESMSEGVFGATIRTSAVPLGVESRDGHRPEIACNTWRCDSLCRISVQNIIQIYTHNPRAATPTKFRRIVIRIAKRCIVALCSGSFRSRRCTLTSSSAASGEHKRRTVRARG